MQGAVEAPQQRQSTEQEAETQLRPRPRGRAVRASAAATDAAAGRAGRAGRGRAGRGRGRGGRTRQPDVPLPEQHEQQSDSDSSSSSSSSSDGEGRSGPGEHRSCEREQRDVAASAVELQQLSVREQAVRLLMQSTGLPQARAELAIDETKGDAEPADPMEWEEKAVCWLADHADFEDERDQLAAAMQVSLEEAERRKAGLKPLAERSPAEIQQEFADSELLQQLAEYSLETVLVPPLLQPLLDYLVLERKCKKWYCIARHYFSSAAAQLVGQLSSHDSPAAASAAAGDPPPRKRRRVAGGASSGGGSSDGQALPALGEEAAAVLAVAVECQRAEVEAAVFAMPAGAGVEVPALFQEAVPAGAEQECVELLDSDDDDGQQQQQQQQQQLKPAAQQEQPQPPAG